MNMYQRMIISVNEEYVRLYEGRSKTMIMDVMVAPITEYILHHRNVLIVIWRKRYEMKDKKFLIIAASIFGVAHIITYHTLPHVIMH